MNVELDTEKAPFCSIGNFYFTIGEPGPKEVNPDELTEEEVKQFLYNINRGVLKADSTEELVGSEKEEDAPSKKESITQQPQIKKEDFASAKKKEDTLLRKILTKNINSVKKEVRDFTPAMLRKLKEFEENDKARKGLMTFFDELLESHTDSVLSNVGGLDVGEVFNQQKVKESEQVSDVEDSEVEEVTFHPVEE